MAMPQILPPEAVPQATATGCPDAAPVPSIWTDQAVRRAVWILVALGVFLRLQRWWATFPLWGDEAYLATNFLDRSYADLLRPLEYRQVSPLLFLWAEKTAVALFGFHEKALRLVPVLSGVAGLLLFGHLSGRILSGFARVVAVGFLAVAFYPIRHAVEVKPYSSDLLVSMILLTMAAEWWRTPERTGWLWGLAAFTPLALGLSHPAVFAAGGIAIGLFDSIRTIRSRSAWLPYGLYVALIPASFLFYFAVFTAAQSGQVLGSMQEYWAESFPPLRDPLGLIVWLVSMHTGNLFAFPIGGERGASVLTFLCFVVGARILWKSGRRPLAIAVLSTFGLGLMASVVRRYPYGGEVRFMLYVAPGLCLMAGAGAATLIGRMRWPSRKAALGFAGLLGIGGVIFVGDRIRPYQIAADVKAREFSRWLWNGQGGEAEVVCLKTDLGVTLDPEHWQQHRTANYLCNQRIYSERHARKEPPRLERVSDSHPLRCVLINELPDHQAAFDAWLVEMSRDYELVSKRNIDLNLNPREAWNQDRFVILDFVPRSGAVAGRDRTNPR